jgi:hypothetical protein
MLLANSEIVGILPHPILLKSPEIRIPPPSKPWSVTLKMDRCQFANNIKAKAKTDRIRPSFRPAISHKLRNFILTEPLQCLSQNLLMDDLGEPH